MRGPAECAVRNVSSILINMVKQYIEENRERFLEELFELCDRVEVIRDGEFIATKPIDQWDNDSLITAMVGRSLDNQFPKEFGEKSKDPML